jgi:hypothetical protein
MGSCKMAVYFAPELAPSERYACRPHPPLCCLSAIRHTSSLNNRWQAFKNCEFVFPDAPHPPSEVVFKPAPGAEAEGAGNSCIFAGLSHYVMIKCAVVADDDASNTAALAWYGWHPNRESCVSFTGIEESLRSIAQARASAFCDVAPLTLLCSVSAIRDHSMPYWLFQWAPCLPKLCVQHDLATCILPFSLPKLAPVPTYCQASNLL